MQIRRRICTTFLIWLFVLRASKPSLAVDPRWRALESARSNACAQGGEAGSPLRPSRSTAGAARPHLILPQSRPPHAVLNRHPSAQKDHGKTRCAIGAAPQEMWHWSRLSRLIGRCTSLFGRLSEGAERRGRGRGDKVCSAHPLSAERLSLPAAASAAATKLLSRT